MAKEGQNSRLQDPKRVDVPALDVLARQIGQDPNVTAPVARSNSSDCGDIDICIDVDGQWYYQGTLIGRPALVKLFASVLERDGERYCLVTPVEKCGIRVVDAPFLAVEVDVVTVAEPDGRSTRVLRFRTNVDDWIECDAEHGLRFEPQHGTGGLVPYLHVRRGLWAKATRAVFHELVSLGEERELYGRRLFGVASRDVFFAMASAEEMRD
jgi:uncharacterized protein